MLAAWLAWAAVALGASVGTVAAQTVTVVEYYNTTLNAYFITGRASEQAVLDTLPDFRRTGMTFQARAASAALPGQQPVCRYMIQVTPSFASHFYGLTADCALIADLIAQGRITNFVNEGLDFAVEPTRADGTCNAGSFPVYRSLRLGGSQVDVPNHRYSVIRSDYDDSVRSGFVAEGAVFCVPQAVPVTPPEDLSAWELTHRNLCAVPRSGTSPLTGQPYPDRPGSIEDEKRWLRGYTDLTYLWWRESPRPALGNYPTPQSLFPALLSPARIVSGRRKDVYSWFEPAQDYERKALGFAYGYGFSWVIPSRTPPRELRLRIVDEGSPAAAAGLARGDRLLSVNGVDFVNATGETNVAIINRALVPPTPGETHTFVFESTTGQQKTVTLTSADLPIQTVPAVTRIMTPSGPVGYIHLTTFSALTAEKAFADAVSGLIAAGGVRDLVLDLRYNGGGSVALSSRVAYMLAGATKTAGKRYVKLVQNEKKAFGADFEYGFLSTGSGNPGGVASGTPLPSLNLDRLFVLTGPGSASASESVINALRGIGMPVITVGETTYGKPVGQYVVDNCGTSHNLINFITVNHEGKAEYFEGFAPTCRVGDDLSRPLGSPDEAMLATALAYRAGGQCPPASAESAKSGGVAVDPAASFSGWRPEATVPAAPLRTDRGLPITPRAPFQFDLTTQRR